MTDDTKQTEAIDRDARRWATICHLVALVGLLGNGIGFLLGPLVVWLLKREDHPFIDEQGKEAVNFQITVFIAFVISVLLALVIIGFGLLLIVLLAAVVFPIIGAIKANEGEHFKYPVSIRFIK
ncbi:MAG: DUF4870 domain-containing protein [Candidatus Latescibacterota bacterium]|nr:MAG: DUF4870 domain-containing protein [Candidatus Latescibacterota bacterium]